MVRQHISRFVTQHALFWLMIGNAVGVWLALLLIFPQLNNLTGEITYGRILPVHLNLQLYGWTSLPLVAWLFHLYPSEDQAGDGLARGAILLWSATLLIASISWMFGRSSGKIFIEWQGFARVLFSFNLLGLWTALFFRFLQLRNFRETAQLLRLSGLVTLAAVIPTWYWASSPSVYPAVNPDSGGPTAGSLLGSTLFVVLLLILAGRLFATNLSGNWERIGWVMLTFDLVIFALFGSGNNTHLSLFQVALLAALLPWPAILVSYFRHSVLPPGSYGWLKSALGWFALLTFTGWLSFLPKVLDGWKFTNGLVAHSHLAMAGFVTCFNIFILASLGEPFSSRSRKWWNVATFTHVALMWVAGTMEASNPGFTILPGAIRTLLYAARAAVGAVMLATSIVWWRNSLRTTPEMRVSDISTSATTQISLAA